MGSCVQSWIWKNQINKYILGLDLGTSSVKLVLTDGDGHMIDSSRESYPLSGKGEGRYEQDPTDWYSAIKKAVKTLSERNDLSKVIAIGLSGQMPSLVLLDKEYGEPIGNSILWCDSRADGIAGDLLQKLGKEEYYLKTGIILDGRYLAPMYLWLKNQGLRGNYYILSAKDYICYLLSGALVTDPSTASGYAVYSLTQSDWDKDLCKKIGIDIRSLPVIRESSAVVGNLKEDIAVELGLSADAKIINGGADSVCGVLGAGATDAGTVSQMWGTSTAIIGLTDSLNLNTNNNHFVTPMGEPGTYGAEADLISTGASFEWINKVAGGKDYTKSLGGLPPGSCGLLFFPFITGGEQGVLWDPDLKAGLIGLTEKHGITHIVNALMEGMCFEVKRCIESFGMDVNKIICMGHASEEPYFMQMMADVMGKECFSVGDSHDSALGAAYLAGIGIGSWSFGNVPKQPGSHERTYRPEKNKNTAYEKIYKAYIENTHLMKQNDK